MGDYKWKPIEDLPKDWTKLASSELGGLAAVWVEHYETIKDSKALKQFNERLRREWAIETGIIENLYYIDRGVTLTLIEKGIEASLIPHGSTDRPAELIVPILKDHEEVVTGLFDFVGQQRQLSTSYIKQLHQALTQHQRTTAAKDNFGTMMEVELLRGDWKKLPNNPTKSDDSVHEYCPPEQVASEMDRLISLHQEHSEKNVPPEVEAAWLHHRFTQIHPFQDGNGRMARTLASLIFLRAGLFPLVIHRDERDDYIDALEIADQRNINLLVQFFSRAQKKAINQALSLSENILSEGIPLEQVIAAAAERLKKRRNEHSVGFEIGQRLEQFTKSKLNDVAQKLNLTLRYIDNNYHSTLAFSNQSSHHSYDSEVADLAKRLNYFADTKTYSRWIYLSVREENQTNLIISFHALGDNFSGVFAVLAFIQHSSESLRAGNPYLLTKDFFQFTDQEQEQEVVDRFRPWLDNAVLLGIDLWRRQL